ncbi:MAG: hypothetical protein LBI99_09125 [Propionibacteriaceae bacterium]|jgi:hypothetical protein|nr:hypothetical protein [Propionibacteriaceae bacterium]
MRLFLLVPVLLLLSGCVPSYDVGYTLHNGKPAVYMPICEGWKVERFSIGTRASGSGSDSVSWSVESVGGNTNFFVLGEVPEGYRVTSERDPSSDFPLNAEYLASIYQSLPGDTHKQGPGTQSMIFDFTDAEEGVIKILGRVVTLDQLNASLASRCPA